MKVRHLLYDLESREKKDFIVAKKAQQLLKLLYFPNIKQSKPKLPFPFTSNAVPLCGTHSLFKDPVFLTDYSLLMVKFCNRFGVGHRWQQPEGIPDGFGV